VHIVISWDIKASEPQWGEIDEKLKATFSGYSWVRPLTTFYVLKIASEADRALLRDRLVAVARASSSTVHIVISPAMSGGRYDGFLPGDAWPKLNARSDP